MTRRRKLVVVVAVLAALQLAAIAAYLGLQHARRAGPAAFVADPLGRPEAAPAIAALRADGSAVAITWPAGAYRLVHFWATWCPPCRDELPGLLAFAREHRARGLELVAIAVDDDWRDIAAFFGGAIPPEVVIERDGAAHHRLGVSTLPDSYLVDRDGRVVERYYGPRDWRAPDARAHVLARLR